MHFKATSFLLETAEFFAEYGPDSYWAFVESWVESGNHDCIGQILNAAHDATHSEDIIKALQLALRFRQYSPRLEMFRSIALESVNNLFNRNSDEMKTSTCCWAEHGTSGIIATTVEELQDLIVSSSQLNTSLIRRASVFDHVFHGPALYKNMSSPRTGLDPQNVYFAYRYGPPTVVLYAAFGTSCFHKFHDIMAAASLRGRIRYIHRPILLAGCEGAGCVSFGARADELKLGGFGVEMAIKNTEYNSIDATGARENIDSILSQTLPVLPRRMDLNGFNFTTLMERFPRLTSTWTTLSSQRANKHENLNHDIWHIKSISLQATQRILSAADPLQMMTDISQNFPSLGVSLSRVKPSNTLRTEIVENQKVVRPGTHAMHMNRRLLKPDKIDVFSLVDQITADVREGHSLCDLGLDDEQIRSLLQPRLPIPSTFGGRQPRINLDNSDVSDLVMWINNIEMDKSFETWSRDIDLLLISAQKDGSMPRLRHNIFNIVAVVDLSQEEGLNLVSTIQRYINDYNLPLRLGLFLVYSETASELDRNRDAKSNGMFRIGKQNEDFELPFDISIGAALARAGTSLYRRYGGTYVGEFVHMLSESRKPASQGNVFNDPVYGNVTWPAAKKLFNQIFKRAFVAQEYSIKGVRPDEEAIDKQLNLALADILSFNLEERDDFISKSALHVNQAKEVIAAKGITCPSVLVNGLYCSLTDARKRGGELEQVMMYLVRLEIQALATATFEGNLTNKILDSHPGGAYGWIHRDATSRYVPFIQDELSFPPEYVVMRPYINTMGRTGELFTHEHIVNYLGEDNKTVKETTIWVVSDASHVAGKAVLDAAVEFSQRNIKGPQCVANARVAILHPPGVAPSPVAREAAQKFRSDHFSNSDLDRLLGQQSNFVAELLGRERMARYNPPAAGMIIVNGRILDIPRDHKVDQEDFCLLLSQEHRARIDILRNIFGYPVHRSSKADAAHRTSDMYMFGASLIASRYSEHGLPLEQADILYFFESSQSVFSTSGGGLVAFEAVLDPLSRGAQRVMPLLNALKDTLASRLSIRIILNPMITLDDHPLSSYYSYAAPLAPMSIYPRAYFTMLPRNKKYTAYLDVPEAWLVTTAATNYDLDHLNLDEVPDGVNSVEAEFQIEALLVTGHCIDVGKKKHPRGLQLVLRNAAEKKETMVMSTLGYFQLPSLPGAWTLELRPGQSANIYYMVQKDELSDHAGEHLHQQPIQDSATEFMLNSTELYVSSWKGITLQLHVNRRQAMETQDVLDGNEDPSRVETKREYRSSAVQPYVQSSKMNGWFSFTSMASVLTRLGLHTSADSKPPGPLKELAHVSRQGASKNSTMNPWSGDKIHIFSIASGYLYERLVKVMMLSVRRKTKNPLKFWFVKSWLSPRFKYYLPYIASKYGFEYELVMYKWPAWLHKQTEKQRIIWAYKLLFLDVIFPLSLEKIIFVDADQVMRADVKELWELDLHGAPYAYTPFCDDDASMDGFRFWKQGFWERHLDGKPYHISALYVVDLKRFRQLAAGDTLRVIYEKLSKDPNSLANLDQDLPNYAQHQVPIFSLPQQWLWCESWCGNQTKSFAKTIDLCNNPKTKEPKLKSAARIIAEWTSLDEELLQHTGKVEQLMHGYGS